MIKWSLMQTQQLRRNDRLKLLVCAKDIICRNLGSITAKMKIV